MAGGPCSSSSPACSCVTRQTSYPLWELVLFSLNLGVCPNVLVFLCSHVSIFKSFRFIPALVLTQIYSFIRVPLPLPYSNLNVPQDHVNFKLIEEVSSSCSFAYCTYHIHCPQHINQNPAHSFLSMEFPCRAHSSREVGQMCYLPTFSSLILFQNIKVYSSHVYITF